MSRVVHIVIVEPSEMVSEGLKAVLYKSGLKCQISHVASVEELLLFHRKKKCHVAVVNPLYIGNHPKILTHAKSECEEVSWLALVYAYFDTQILTQFDDTVTISDTPETLYHKITKLMEPVEGNQLQQSGVLSDREIDVLIHLASGKSNKEIADLLYISVNTVITHRKNISQKTGIKTVSGLTIYAVVQKLIDPEHLTR